MSDDLEPSDPKAQYADFLSELRRLSRDMLLAFRLQVGQMLLDRFYDGDVHQYRDQSPNKEASFTQFAKTCQDDLADMGLSTQLARQCINAHVTFRMLPPGVRDQLLFSHVVELARLDDPTARARLAVDTALSQWNVGQLKTAIARVHDGSYYDTDPITPGTQPPAPKPEPDKLPQPGRLITQLVKAGDELAAWQAAWSTVEVAKLRGAEKKRCAGALAALKARVAELEVVLGGAGE